MRSHNAVDAGRGWIIVEEYIAPAVDLDVNETGSQPATAGQLMHRHIRWDLPTGAKPTYARLFDEDCPMSPHQTAVENRIGGNAMRWGPAHVVRVIFCRLRGLSTAISRRSARMSIIA